MAKKKRNPSPGAAVYATKNKGAKEAGESDHFAVTREFVESLVVAVILALLFRAFEAEAFVIPTGSMATTLLGRHKDVTDEYTGYQYTVGASGEVDRLTQQQKSNVVQAIDPLYHRLTDVSQNPSYSGDRILVSKFAYDFSSPKRWDVIVFKFPMEPQTNYIKRLIGLPGETVRIFHGDIYIKQPGEAEFSIARKPPAKQLTLQRLIYDTDYPCAILEEAGFPDRLEAYPESTQGSWMKQENGSFVCQPQGETWLRYRHVLPDNGQHTRYWAMAENHLPIDTQIAREECSQLITDFTAYNTDSDNQTMNRRPASGLHWVGDLSLEATSQIESSEGVFSFDLVEGGAHFRCDIDVATGQATLSSSDSDIEFTQQGPIQANTVVKGPGTYSFRFSNFDNELRLWVNDSLVDFGGPVTFTPKRDLVPEWSPEDPGDLLPAGIGTSSVKMTVTRVRMYRDVYYIATDERFRSGRHSEPLVDYQEDSHPGWNVPNASEIMAILTDPSAWSKTRLFRSRREAIFELESEQYFPLGDNSAESSDARLWTVGQQFVPKHMLIGKALFVYWPHSKNTPVPFFPNFSRMKFIQ